MIRVSSTIAVLALCACGATPAPPPAPAAQTPAAAATAPSPRTTRFVFVTNTRRSGEGTITFETDGTRRSDTKILQNGRGPACKATIRYGADGTLAFLEATGHDWIFKDAPERFVLEGGRATWSNLAEKGERAASGPAFYIGVCSEFDTLAGLVRALQRHGGRLPLIPSGEARLETLGERRLTAAGGRSANLVGHAIHGLELGPSYVWLEDGEIFAALSTSWGGWIRDGFE